MFVWAPIPEPFRAAGSLDFAVRLAQEADVAVSPGVGFGEGGDGHVRFALVENEQRIAQATRSIRRMLAAVAVARRLLVRHLPPGPLEARPLLSRLRPCAPVLLAREPLELALQLAPALVALEVERPVRERRAHRAARLLRVRAVGEAALRRERLDVSERGLEAGVRVPELQLAHARRVEHEPAVGQRHELAVRRRVPAAAVLADLLRREQLLAERAR